MKRCPEVRGIFLAIHQVTLLRRRFSILSSTFSLESFQSLCVVVKEQVVPSAKVKTQVNSWLSPVEVFTLDTAYRPRFPNSTSSLVSGEGLNSPLVISTMMGSFRVGHM